jgi:hypothetical protein
MNVGTSSNQASAKAPKITLDSNPSDAPCCLKIISDDGRDLLIQSDYDFPGIANAFGWNMRSVQNDNGTCEHTHTDGTIDCPDCGIKALTFIHAAREWLDDNDGATAEDPGYFDN